MRKSGKLLKTFEAASLVLLFLLLTGQRQVSETIQGTADASIYVGVYLQGGEGSTLNFKVTLESFTADLKPYKFDEIVVLRAEGKEYRPIVRSEDASGNQRSASIEFNKPPHIEEVEILVSNVGGNNVRIFKFQL